MSGVSSGLRERVQIQQRIASSDGAGGQTVSWGLLATVFASVEPIHSTAQAKSLAGQMHITAGYRVRIRLRSDVSPTMRLLWKGYSLTIHTLVERAEMLEILTYVEGL